MLFSANYSESLLYTYFHEYYSEVVRLKQLIKAGGLVIPRQGGEQTEASTRVTPAYIHHRLLPILERQRAEAAHRGGEYGATLYREAQYLMVALTDEIFLHRLAWDGREEWRNNLLESRLFDTYIGGERFFQNLDRLLTERNPVYADLARIYLIALSLGFQGRYRHTPQTEELERYQRELFTFITKRNPDGLYQHLHYDEDKRLFGEAYGYTIKESKTRPLPSARRWFIILGLVILGLLAISHFLWQYHTAPLFETTETIMQEKEF